MRLTALRSYGDWMFAIGLAVALEVEVWVASYATHREALTLVVLLVALPFGLRCRYPLASILAVWIGMTIGWQISPPFNRDGVVGVIPFVFSLYSFGANARGKQAWAAVVVVPAVAAVFVTDDGDPFFVGDLLFAALIVGGPWAAGLAMRLRREREHRLEREKEVAEEAIVEERARIARELHDVVAHAISVIVLQARGGRKLLATEPDETRGALETIERTGEQALDEMRRLVGLLRDNDGAIDLAPQPSLSQLERLAGQVRAAGLPVEVVVEGTPAELPPGVDLSAYRIVQEALTNALKHAGPARARVRVRYGADSLVLDVADDGAGADGADGGGHGLAGMRERVSVYGGELAAGPRPEGGFAVHVRLPYASER